MRFDVCVVGGGIAGISVAALLARTQRVVLLEREAHLAMHSSGRSAALYLESYGNVAVRALTSASRDFYLAEHDGRVLTQPRGALYLADAAQLAALGELEAELTAESPAIHRIEPAEALRLCPALRPERLAGALLDPLARDIDVAGALDHYARLYRARAGELVRNAEVRALGETEGLWRIETAAGTFSAATLINAAGAWADELARLAGVRPLGLTPRRRTAARVAAEGWSIAAWPCVADATEQWYFKPDAGALLLSPADETPSAPCDAHPEDEDVALAIDRVEQATQLSIGRPLASWAGLRTFASDRTPVVGFDARARGFFWFAGQGGYGIQMAPALAALAAEWILTGEPPRGALPGVDPAALSPARFSA